MIYYSTQIKSHTIWKLCALTLGNWTMHQTLPYVPLLTKRHHQLLLYLEHRDWTIDEWKRVAWLDESQFVIHHADGDVKVFPFQTNSCSNNVQQAKYRWCLSGFYLEFNTRHVLIWIARYTRNNPHSYRKEHSTDEDTINKYGYIDNHVIRNITLTAQMYENDINRSHAVH